jgi:hypothetical protein
LLSGRKARGIWQAALWSLPFPAFSREFLLIYEDLQMLHFYTVKTIFSFTSKRKAILSFAFSMSIFSAHSQQISTDSTEGNSLEPVVVTAARTETKKASIAQKLDVITSEDIQMTPATDLTDIVRKMAAVDVIQYPNLSSGIGIRGFRPQFSGLNQRT